MIPYVVSLAEGEFRIQGHTQPIDEVLASGQLSEQDAAKLQLVVAARDFAINTIGLDAGSSYTEFYDTSGDPLAWNLSAARRDALIPKTWCFPIVGTVPYLAFFDESLLHQFQDQLDSERYDTLTYELDAYSTLGYFNDPVSSTMLRRSDLSLADTVIHELLHGTIYRSGDTNFNESLATFVGRTGAIQFLRAEFGDNSGWPQLAEQVYADTDKVNAFLMQLYADLQAYYDQAPDYEEAVAGREAVFQAARDRFVQEVQPTLNLPDVFASYASLPTNNAWVLAEYRYNLDLGVFQSVYDATGQSWPAALDVFRAAAGDAGDPFAYLRDWLAQQGQ
jgi:predicted aminopeptidase